MKQIAGPSIRKRVPRENYRFQLQGAFLVRTRQTLPGKDRKQSRIEIRGHKKACHVFSIEKWYILVENERKGILTNKAAEKILNIIREEHAHQAETIGEARQRLKVFYLRFRSKLDITVEPVFIGHVPAFWISAPGASKDRTVLFFHGGGFMVGSTEDHLDLCGKLSHSAECRVLSVDYRLAPEHVFPAALDDCIASYLWLIETGATPSQIITVGISAGGNLILSMFMKLRAMGIPLPKAAVCISPAVDMTSREDTFEKNIAKDWISKEDFELLRRIYLRKHDPKDPLVSPTHGDLRDFPPLFIQAGTHETLFDDISTFVGKAKEMSVDITFDAWEGMFHCWQIFSLMLPEGQRAIDNVGTFIRKTFQTG
jgi:epsilon-lactone hydrolase